MPVVHEFICMNGRFVYSPFARAEGRYLVSLPSHPIIDGHRVCTKCTVSKPIAEFHINKHSPHGLRPNCKVCNNKVGHQYYADTREARIAYQRAYNKTEHRMSYARNYQAARSRRLRDEQAARPRPEACEVCGRSGKIVYDHDHRSGLFRGWLCDYCNRAIGLLGDSPDVLRLLASYLENAHACQRIA